MAEGTEKKHTQNQEPLGDEITANNINPHDKESESTQQIKSDQLNETDQDIIDGVVLPGEDNGEDEITSLNNELAKLKEENEALNLKVARTMADFENFKRRNRIESEQKLKYAIQSVCSDLLGSIDNLERAISAAVAENNETVSNFVEGIKMVHKQFLGIFEQYGIQKIKPIGTLFDPNFHEAVGTVVSEEIEENHVAEVLREGYIFHDRVIRPAMVHIATKKDSN